MDSYATTSGSNSGWASDMKPGDVMKAMKDAMEKLGPRPPRPFNQWYGSIPTIRWTIPITVYVYPADRWVSYGMDDYDWTSWCGFGKHIQVEYDEQTKEATNLPKGWVLPHDWKYIDPLRVIRYMDWFPVYRPGLLIHAVT